MNRHSHAGESPANRHTNTRKPLQAASDGGGVQQALSSKEHGLDWQRMNILSSKDRRLEWQRMKKNPSKKKREREREHEALNLDDIPAIKVVRK